MRGNSLESFCNPLTQWHATHPTEACMDLCSEHAIVARQNGYHVAPQAGVSLSNLQQRRVYGGFSTQQLGVYGFIAFLVIAAVVDLLNSR